MNVALGLKVGVASLACSHLPTVLNPASILVVVVGVMVGMLVGVIAESARKMSLAKEAVVLVVVVGGAGMAMAVMVGAREVMATVA